MRLPPHDPLDYEPRARGSRGSGWLDVRLGPWPFAIGAVVAILAGLAQFSGRGRMLRQEVVFGSVAMGIAAVLGACAVWLTTRRSAVTGGAPRWFVWACVAMAAVGVLAGYAGFMRW